MIEIEKIINRIDELTKFNGWSLYKLAKRADISPSSINNIYNRKTYPTIPTLECICDGLNISLSEFFDFQENPLRDFSMSEDEQTLLNSYRNLSASKKALLKAYLKGINDSMVKSEDEVD